MKQKNAFLRGTMILTSAGLLSRLIGFFYRIFLAHAIGAEGMGIYQLIFPIYSICFSLCASGIETAISKLTAAQYTHEPARDTTCFLRTGITLSLVLSLGCSFIMFTYAQNIAQTFLKDARCSELLKLLAFTIPFGTIQSCFCGYYFGIHQAAVPAASQLIEQGFRTGFVFLLCKIFTANNLPISPVIAVAGLVLGEFSSFLFTVTCFSFHLRNKRNFSGSEFSSGSRKILKLAVPLTVSRISIQILASLEATLIPNALIAYGMDRSSALSLYGTLSGMALPFILFPNALTGSISLMLLPAISEIQAGRQWQTLQKTIKKTFSFCLFFGSFFLILFLFFGKFLGSFFFSSSAAGDFITVLAWICPFLYLNTTLNSTLNGLGRTDVTFFNGSCSLFIRIAFIFFCVPKIGIRGYLFALLLSQLFVTLSGVFFLRKTLNTAFSDFSND